MLTPTTLEVLNEKEELYLSLITDEIDFWFTGLSWSWSWDHKVRLFVGLLDQDVHQSLFFILLDLWNYRSPWGRWRWSLDKYDLVMFLRWWNHNWFSVKINNNKMKKK